MLARVEEVVAGSQVAPEALTFYVTGGSGRGREWVAERQSGSCRLKRRAPQDACCPRQACTGLRAALLPVPSSALSKGSAQGQRQEGWVKADMGMV